ncbi:MAG TPA: hypothetical protein EYQ83_02255 [Acidobacteria bacterium]|nr:hypothetical protein [Acidobacteriota bacterium]
MTGTDDHVEGVEVELFDRGWEQREQRSVIPIRPRQPLNERRVHRSGFDGRRDRPRHVQEGKPVRVRKQLTDGIQRAFAAPHSGEPVVHEGDPQAGSKPRRRGERP